MINPLFLIPIVFSSIGTYSSFSVNYQVIKRANENDISADQIKQFDINDYDKIGISTETVCSSDVTLEGESCVSADLNGLGINKLVYGLNLSEDKFITFSDDPLTKSIYLYVYRYDIENNYSRISLSTRKTDYEDFDFLSETSTNDTAFSDYPIKLVSISSNYRYAKYKVNADLIGVADNFWDNQRTYVLRQMVVTDKQVLPVALQFTCNNSADTQTTSLDYFVAEQLLFDNWFRVKTGLDYGNLGFFLGGIFLPISLANYILNDNTVAQQNMLLFNLTQNQEDIVDLNLKAVRVGYTDRYQMKGETNIQSTINANQANNFLSQMPNGWQVSTGFLDTEEKQKVNSVKTILGAVCRDQPFAVDVANCYAQQAQFRKFAPKTITKYADEEESFVISGGLFDLHQRTYSWNGVGKVSDWLSLNSKNGVIRNENQSILSNYNYYAMLDTTIMHTVYSGWTNNYRFGVGDYAIDGRNNQLDPVTLKYELPTVYEGVSLTEFWYEEAGAIKKGIVMANYVDSFGAVNLIGIDGLGFGSYDNIIKIVIFVIIGIVVLLLLSLLLNALGIIKPIAKAIIKTIIFIVKIPYFIIRGIAKLFSKRKNKNDYGRIK